MPPFDISRTHLTMLIAEDDDEDRELIKEACTEGRVSHDLYFVYDGEELMDYLHRTKKFEDIRKYPDPGIILLDLSMPKKNGLFALHEIKSNSNLKEIPVIIFTTSTSIDDVKTTYRLGANSFINKPSSFPALVTIMKKIGLYWFDTVVLPEK